MFNRNSLIKKEKEKEEEEKKEEEDEEGAQDKEDSEEVKLRHLFKFSCDITEGRNVSCMDFNIANSDLLGVGYGE